MILNFNIGLLGHVDSGKTTLARVLSSISSTAAFDKNPQSKERGITLDLGFSALFVEPTPQLKSEFPGLEQVQLTFVDCPGHASLIKTIIGGAQVIDLMILVVDAVKGVQTQTAECIVIGELLQRKLIVAVNKIDLLDEKTSDLQLAKLNAKLRKTLGRTAFGANIPIFNVSALNGICTKELLEGICSQIHLPKRNLEAPLVIYADHCFSIKGKGIVCTGTIIQGQIAVNDSVEIPSIREQRKVKSIQMFHRPVQKASMGDRVGLCFTKFNSNSIERAILTQPGYLHPIYAACICLERIHYYKFPIKSKSKIHITVAHDTVMSSITLFRDVGDKDAKIFDSSKEYEFVEELETVSMGSGQVFALLEFETPILAISNATLIASKLDMDVHSKCCRLVFWGHIQWKTHFENYLIESLSMLKIFKIKEKQGTIQRVIDDNHAIVQNLFKKESNRNLYVGKNIQLSTGESGVVESTFGQTSKMKIYFPNGLKPETQNLLKTRQSNEVIVLLKLKKSIFNKTLGYTQ